MQVVKNALRVLEEIARREPCTLADLHRALGLPKTTVHRALGSLAESGWAHCDEGDGRWRLTLRAAVLGVRAASAGGLRELALPAMQALRDRTGESVHLTVPQDGHVVLIERVDSPRAVRTHNPLGVRAPFHASANGKAILATLGPEALEDALHRDRASFTDRTITERDRLRFEIASVRARRFAVNRGEFVSEVAAVAAAITGDDGRAVAAISLSAPVHRLPEERAEAYGPWVVEAADEIGALVRSARIRAAESSGPA